MARVLHFVFKNSNEVIYDENCVFKKNKNKISFICNNETFVINYSDNSLKFSKESDDGVFTLESDSHNCSSRIYLKKENIKFDMKVIDFKYVNDNNNMEIKYIIECDEKSVKSLKIRY